ncbi:hypothetical protein SAMN05421810_101804 [Amycolatopsis arida]|uniref:Uncharacterized protein n=1 Tax=Amycolatopsis arida TaxID=587909 RepID=A0A1I5M6A6_9PSEU|nr:hypothetical protein [Amycolatopsis arida]TDX93979.1 hypothetical protein CLV69_104436 [Amycolatopsis arida]SFP04867.1 hypothetical protein SAMN05421810_101804 [Amycolatopsis arida]
MTGSTALAELEARAEVDKLARLLRTEPERLEFLAGVDPADVRRFREQVVDTLFDAHGGVLGRMAGASRLLPGAVLAKIAERVFGPLLCARIAGLVDVSRGVDVARRLPPAFLADVAAELDPRRAGEIITRIPAPTVVAVARELVARRDWITISRFFDRLPDPTVTAVLPVIPDAGLLRIAFVVDAKDRIDHVLGLVPAERFPGMAAAAAREGLWPATFGVLTHLGEANRRRLLDAVGELDPEVRADAAEHARALGLLAEPGPVRDALGG